MYANPTYLPQFSNREDLYLPAALFDDNTGEPLDFSGCTRAQPGDYTTNQWVVTDGPIITSSQSVLTIPTSIFSPAIRSPSPTCRAAPLSSARSGRRLRRWWARTARRSWSRKTVS